MLTDGIGVVDGWEQWCRLIEASVSTDGIVVGCRLMEASVSTIVSVGVDYC